tara:strand:- start:5051 stop:5647 length:597 start_codon:yes stop_codon:yes gene_type:complete
MGLLRNLLFFVFLISCSNSNKNINISLKLPNNIVKIENKHAVFLSPERFKIKKIVKSEDCESWQINYNFKKLFNDSYIKLLNSMFDDLVFVDRQLSIKEIEDQKFISFINFKENFFFLEFYTFRNTGKLKISLTSDFVVEGKNRKVKNIIKSEQSWEKNIYFNCRVTEGVSKISNLAFEGLINQAHEKIYSSVKNIVR